MANGKRLSKYRVYIKMKLLESLTGIDQCDAERQGRYIPGRGVAGGGMGWGVGMGCMQSVGVMTERLLSLLVVILDEDAGVVV